MIIDMHTHIFADSLAPRALAQLQETANIPAYTNLTEADTRAKLEEWGVDLAVVQPIATKPAQQHTINTWAQGIQHGQLVSFGTVFAPDPSALDTVDEIVSLGLRGVKLHPDYQRFDADDPSVFPVYEKIAQAGLPVTFHAGYDPVSKDHTHCTPAMLARVHEAVPDLTIIAAHLGGYAMADESEALLAGKDIYMDISMAVQFCDFAQFERIVLKHGTDRILYGTDMPWSSTPETIAWVERLDLPQEDKDKIFWKNAARLLGMSAEDVRQASGSVS